MNARKRVGYARSTVWKNSKKIEIMKKHIIGFALFSFIVSTAVVVSVSISVSKEFERTRSLCLLQITPQTPAAFEQEARTGKIADDSPIVNQAVFSLKTKQINMELLFNAGAKPQQSVPLVLNFFRKDGRNAKFLARVKTSASHNSFYYAQGETAARFVGSFDWLDNLQKYDNLYVTVECDSESSVESAGAPVFDYRFAKPVTLAWNN